MVITDPETLCQSEETDVRQCHVCALEMRPRHCATTLSCTDTCTCIARRYRQRDHDDWCISHSQAHAGTSTYTRASARKSRSRESVTTSILPGNSSSFNFRLALLRSQNDMLSLTTSDSEPQVVILDMAPILDVSLEYLSLDLCAPDPLSPHPQRPVIAANTTGPPHKSHSAEQRWMLTLTQSRVK